MTTPISPIGTIGSLSPLASTAGAAATSGATAASGSSGANFASALANGFDQVAAAQNNANELAVQAATGQLVDPAQLTIATTQAQLLTQLASAVQSKAVTAFNTIMSMQA